MLRSGNGKPNLYFYIVWLVLGAASIFITWGLTWAVLMVAKIWLGDYILVGGQRHITEDYLVGLVLIPMLGLVTGLLQYLVLRQVLPRLGWWIAATLGGFLAFMGLLRAAAWLFPESLSQRDPLPMVIGSALAGGLIGLCQWLVLRKKLRQSGWWIPGVALTWGLIFLINSGNISNSWDVAAVAVLPPLVTGLMLWLLFRFQDRPAEDIPAAVSPA